MRVIFSALAHVVQGDYCGGYGLGDVTHHTGADGDWVCFPSQINSSTKSKIPTLGGGASVGNGDRWLTCDDRLGRFDLVSADFQKQLQQHFGDGDGDLVDLCRHLFPHHRIVEEPSIALLATRQTRQRWRL